MIEETKKGATHEFYIHFDGLIMVIAEDWNDAAKKANHEFITRGITQPAIKAIIKKKYISD